VGDPTCYFCSLPESCDHIFFQCTVAKVVWGVVGVCGGKQHPTRFGTIQWLDQKMAARGWNSPHLWLCSDLLGYMKCRNRACFDQKMIKNPAEILMHVCAFMNYWAGLYNAEFQEKLMDGVKVLLSCTHRVLAQLGPLAPLLQLPVPSDARDDSDDVEE